MSENACKTDENFQFSKYFHIFIANSNFSSLFFTAYSPPLPTAQLHISVSVLIVFPATGY